MPYLNVRPLLMLACMLATTAAAAGSPAAQEDPGMLGFSAANATNQQSLEQRFDALLDPAD
ncbi:MAG: hypothetical protein ABI343_00205, partial [Burkholderiaceae bacterium]